MISHGTAEPLHAETPNPSLATQMHRIKVATCSTLTGINLHSHGFALRGQLNASNRSLGLQRREAASLVPQLVATFFGCNLRLGELARLPVQEWHLGHFSKSRHCTARPNPSVKLSTNGGPPGPGRQYGVHFCRPGPGVPPLAPAYLER